MNRYWCLIPVIFMSLTSCAFPTQDRIIGRAPIYPKLPHFVVGSRTVESLSPTFRWEPSQEANATYDVVVYEMLDGWVPGKEVYYREGIVLAEHQMEKPLQPNRPYYWSVRDRRGEHISGWSRFYSGVCYLAFAFIIPFVECHTTDYPFYIFETPKE